MINPELNLIESQSERNKIMANMTHPHAVNLMGKVKPFIGSRIKEISTDCATTKQMAKYYEVPTELIEATLNQNAKEFAEDWLIAAMQLREALFETRTGCDFMMLDESDKGKLRFLQVNRWTDLIPIKKSLVYFILDTKNRLIKIGFSKNVEARLTNLQVGNVNNLRLLGVCDGGRTKENVFHKKFVHRKVRSEWFQDCKEIRDCIASLPPLEEHQIENFWTPRAAIRLGMLLKDSAIADQLRSVLIESKNDADTSSAVSLVTTPFSRSISDQENTVMKSSTLVQTFTFESKNVRVVEIDGDPWFVLGDVLKAIVSETTVTAAESTIKDALGDGFVSNQPIPDRLGRLQETTIIHEAGVTSLVSRSRTEMGRAFNRHLHAVILPTIRKTGKFVAHPEIESPNNTIAKQLTEINYKLDLLLHAAKPTQSTPKLAPAQQELDLDIVQRFNKSKADLLAARTLENEAKAAKLTSKFAPKTKAKPTPEEIANLIATNSVAAWANERIVLNPSAKTYVGKASGNPKTHLYPNYVNYCKQHQLELVTMQAFSKVLMSLVETTLSVRLGKQRDRQGCHVLGLTIGDAKNLLMAS